MTSTKNKLVSMEKLFLIGILVFAALAECTVLL